MHATALRSPALLDVCATLGLGGVALQVVYGMTYRPMGLMAAAVLSLVACVALWIVWRRSQRLRRPAAVVMAVCTVGVLVTGNGPLTFGAMWVASLTLALSFGVVPTVLYAVGMAAAAATLHIASGNGLEPAVTESVSTLVLGGLGAAFALVLQDASRVDDERERALGELRATNVALQRSLGSEHDLVVAEERQRTARELHDTLGHRLTATGLSLEFAERMRERDPERAHAEVAHAREQVGESLDAMRRIVRAMHPVELRDAHGTDAFHALAEAFGSTGLDIRVDVEGERLLTHEQSLLLVRFVQEGLTNVVRHAPEAHSVDVRIVASHGSVESSIADHGVAAGAHADGFGLRSLRARAEEVGGSLVAHATDDGFAVAMTLPAERVVAQ